MEPLLRHYLEDEFELDWGAERKAGDPIQQAARVLLFSEHVLEQLGSGVADAGNRFALVMFREFATTPYPRFRNSSTSVAPIPREAPVTTAVFCVFAIFKLLLLRDLYGTHAVAALKAR
jgi:hypothetical protein